MKEIGKLVEELEGEVGTDTVDVEKIMDYIEQTDNDAAINSTFPITDSGDALVIATLAERMDEEFLVMSVVLSSGASTYMINENNAERIMAKVDAQLSKLTVYTTHNSLHSYGEFMGEGIKGQSVVVLDEVVRQNNNSYLRRFVKSRARSNTGQRPVLSHIRRLFMDYFVYLNVKFDAKNINGGKYKVKVEI